MQLCCSSMLIKTVPFPHLHVYFFGNCPPSHRPAPNVVKLSACSQLTINSLPSPSSEGWLELPPYISVSRTPTSQPSSSSSFPPSLQWCLLHQFRSEIKLRASAQLVSIGRGENWRDVTVLALLPFSSKPSLHSTCIFFGILLVLVCLSANLALSLPPSQLFFLF